MINARKIVNIARFGNKALPKVSTRPIIRLPSKAPWTEPTPPTDYEVVMVKDLSYTKIWMFFKTTGI